MGEHTKGPWNVCPGDASWVQMPGIAKPINCGNQANARLIAAAPDLLEALKHVRQWLGVDLFSDGDVYHSRCAQSLALIDDALSAASGRAPTNKEE